MNTSDVKIKFINHACIQITILNNDFAIFKLNKLNFYKHH